MLYLALLVAFPGMEERDENLIEKTYSSIPQRLGAKLASHFLGTPLVQVSLRMNGALVAVQDRLVGEKLVALVATEPSAVQLIQVSLVCMRVVGLEKVFAVISTKKKHGMSVKIGKLA